MSLTNQWKNRIQLWLGELTRDFYRELGEIGFSGFTVKEHLSPQEAEQGAFSPMPPGTAWGAKWEYGWFAGELVLPQSAAGRRIVVKPDFGAECLLLVDGKAAGAIDKEHREITLAQSGIAGTRYRLLAEAYAGHGPRLEEIGPVRPGTVPIPEPGPTQAAVGRSGFGIWDDVAFKLWVEAETLFQLRSCLPESSLRVSEIDGGLKDFTLLVDFELPPGERTASFGRGRARLAPLLACVNGSTAPVMHIFGNSHLDLAWLWPRAETARKAARTLANQLALMEEYPGYRYFLNQAPLFLMVNEGYPELYGRLREKIREGRIDVDGAMWLEPDTNIPSGESLIRHLAYGIEFYREEFGVESRVLWLPDTFGFSAALPQIMAGCGVRRFATKKIADTYSGGEPFPHTLFLWQGLDGTRVLTHVTRKSNSPIDPGTLARRWNEDRRQKDGISVYLMPFGHGDGGGGPTRTHLEHAGLLGDLEGLPKTRMSSLAEFFDDVEAKCPPGDVFVGELYFPEHRGVYTSQAGTKRGNRKSEFALREMEFWSAAAGAMVGFSFPREEADRLWKMLLFNQFHDIVSGTSIRRVHEEAEQDFAEIVDRAEAISREAAKSIAGAGNELVVFNSMPWDRTELVALPEDASSGELGFPTQEIEGRRYAELRMPPCGWAAYRCGGAPRPKGKSARADTETGHRSKEEAAESGAHAALAQSGARTAAAGILENEYLRVEFDPSGGISRLYDKETGREALEGTGNRFLMFKDVPATYDAWDIDRQYEMLPIPLEERAEIEIVSPGPLAAVLLVKRMLRDSTLRQHVVLKRGTRVLEFRTHIDWNENHKLLKVSFPTGIHATEGVHEIQFGHVRRPSHRSRPLDAELFEVPCHKWSAVMDGSRGVAVLNDSKYGASVSGGTLSLTALKAAYVPDMRADRGPQEFVYALYPWNGPFSASGVVKESYFLNRAPLLVRGGKGAGSLFISSDPAIVLETLKPARDGSGDVILRVYESMGTAPRCRLRIGIPFTRAHSVDMLENGGTPVGVTDGCLDLDFNPFEIKTLRLGPRR